jgi:16S rRNA (cytidine1402-2'-O)-methyltransferase
LCPIPGPSALAAGLSVSGQAAVPCVFLGFLPAKPGARRSLLTQAGKTGWSLVMFEAPHRLAAAAEDLAKVLGDRPVALAREVSKVHEQVVHTTCFALAEMTSRAPARGEITLVVGPAEAERQEARSEDGITVDELLKQGLAQGDLPPSRLAQKVAAACRMPRKDVYRRLLRMTRD